MFLFCLTSTISFVCWRMSLFFMCVCSDVRPWMCTFCVFNANQVYRYADEQTIEAVLSRQTCQHMLVSISLIGCTVLSVTLLPLIPVGHSLTGIPVSPPVSVQCWRGANICLKPHASCKAPFFMDFPTVFFSFKRNEYLLLSLESHYEHVLL